MSNPCQGFKTKHIPNASEWSNQVCQYLKMNIHLPSPTNTLKKMFIKIVCVLKLNILELALCGTKNSKYCTLF